MFIALREHRKVKRDEEEMRLARLGRFKSPRYSLVGRGVGVYNHRVMALIYGRGDLQLSCDGIDIKYFQLLCSECCILIP